MNFPLPLIVFARSLSHSVILVLYDLFYSIIIQTYNYIDLYESMYVCSYIYGYVCYLDNMSFTISIIFSFFSLSLLVLINQLLHFFLHRNCLKTFCQFFVCLFVIHSFIHSLIDIFQSVFIQTPEHTIPFLNYQFTWNSMHNDNNGNFFFFFYY